MQKHNVDVNNHAIENAFKDIEEIFPDANKIRYYNYLKSTFYESEDAQERGYIFPAINDIKIEKKIDKSQCSTDVSSHDFELKRSGLLYVVYNIDKDEITRNSDRILKLYNEKNDVKIDVDKQIFDKNDDFGFDPENDDSVSMNLDNIKRRRWFHGRK